MTNKETREEKEKILKNWTIEKALKYPELIVFLINDCELRLAGKRGTTE